MRSRQSGLSLVEIMVAMVIGLVGILAMTQAYIMSDRFNRATLGEGSAQTNGLIGLYQLERDLRMAGYGISFSTALSCSEIYWYYNGTYSPVVDASSTLPALRVAPVLITTNGTEPDQITTFVSSEGERMMPTAVTNFSGGTNTVTLDGGEGFKAGDVLLFIKRAAPINCTMARVTAYNSNQATLASGVSGGELNPANWGTFPTYTTDDTVLNLGYPAIRAYSINNRKLRVTDRLEQAAGNTPVDLVDGIVDLRAQYGKDNGAASGTANDGRVDEYSNTTPTTAEQWQQVLSIRIAMLARVGVYEKPSSGSNCDATTASNAPTWSGGSFSKMDFSTATSEDRCYHYRVFETTVPLRNMIWRAL